MLSSLSCCRPQASCIVESSVDEVWAVVRRWDTQHWFNEIDGVPLSVRMIEGSGNAVGSVRAVSLGPASQVFEKLVGIDDEGHSLKWRLISHPDSVSPFPASYINFSTKLKMIEVTHGNCTYVNWEGEFLTEHENAQEMTALFSRWFEVGLKSLQELMVMAKRPPSLRPQFPFPSQEQPLGGGHAQASHWQATASDGRVASGSMPQGVQDPVSGLLDPDFFAAFDLQDRNPQGHPQSYPQQPQSWEDLARTWRGG